MSRDVVVNISLETPSVSANEMNILILSTEGVRPFKTYTSLPEIAEDFGAMLDEKNGVVSGKLVTAVALSDPRKVELKQRLEQQTGKKLELSFATDAEILGGVVLQIGDSVLDASLRAQLNILKETIKRGE